MAKRDRVTAAVLACVLVCVVSVEVQARVLYVDDDALAAGDGVSWQSAYKCLQDALAEANAAGGDIEIRIAGGLYMADRSGGSANGTGDRGATFALRGGVTLYGGYAGFGSPDSNVRDIMAFETVLSGDINGDDGDVDDPCDLLGDPRGVDNSYHVVTVVDANQAVVFDGVTVSQGNADTGYGGGLHCERCSVRLLDCTFMHNRAVRGGGIYSWDCEVQLDRCLVVGNACLEWGGAGMLGDAGSGAAVRNCTFRENVALGGDGGGLRSIAPDVRECGFYDNRALYGGGLFTYEGATVVDCEFSGNSAAIDGGGWYGTVDSKLESCVFRGNYAGGSGGGASFWRESLVVSDCIFIMNVSEWTGGGLYVSQAEMRISGCLFAGNRVERVLGIGGSGGGLCVDAGVGTMSHSVFAGNEAVRGGAMTIQSSVRSADVYMVRVDNCIVSNGEDAITGSNPAYKVSHSCVQGGYPGEGNMDADPCFVDPGYWHDNGTVDGNDDYWVDGDYHLKSQGGRWDPASLTWIRDSVGSGCIDAGNIANPVGLEPFANGGRVNMGLYGGTNEASKSYFGSGVCETIVAGDINGDCRVDAVDFAILSGHWLEVGVDPDTIACCPWPKDRATGVYTKSSVQWVAGVDALSHDIYVGVDEAAVAGASRSSPEYRGNVTMTYFRQQDWAESTIHYWRIDEVYPTTSVKGPVWMFKTRSE